MPEDSFIAVVGALLLPKSREQALRRLVEEGLLDVQSSDRIREALEKSRYNHRGLARELIPLKLLVDEYLSRHRFSPVSPKKTLEAVNRYTSAVEESGIGPVFRLPELSRTSVLDFGCGRLSTLCIPALLWANGADRVYAMEPGPIDVPTARLALSELVRSLLERPDDYNISGIANREMKRRIVSLNFERLTDALSSRGPSDLGGVIYCTELSQVAVASCGLSLSTSVLEHVSELEVALSRLRDVSTPDGVAVHTVDFTSHRKLAADHDPFSFYYDDRDGRGLNMKRLSDVVEMMKDLDYLVSVHLVKSVQLASIRRDHLREAFRNCSDEDLAVRQATVVGRLHR